MAKGEKEKTNVMRVLERMGIEYSSYFYDPSITDGRLVAQALNEDADNVYKTLVTVANNGEYYVFMIPVNQTLDLKKSASLAGVKWIQMIKQKELFPLTGYIHGGCSPIGMKKSFPTYIEESVELFDYVYFSAGRVGAQVKIRTSDIFKIVTSKGDLI